jgi:hypothetical protein
MKKVSLPFETNKTSGINFKKMDLKKGIKLSLNSKDEQTGKRDCTIVFPTLKYPEYWDENNQKYVKITSLSQLESAKQNNEKLIYGGTILIPKGCKTHYVLMDAINTLWEYNKLTSKANCPLFDGDEKAEEMEENEKNGSMYEGNMYFRIASMETSKTEYKRMFKLYNKTDKTGKWIPESNEECYGKFVIPQVTLKYYKSGSNTGLKFYFNGLQILDQNETYAISSLDGFEFEEEDEIENEEKENNIEKAVENIEPADIPDTQDYTPNNIPIEDDDALPF